MPSVLRVPFSPLRSGPLTLSQEASSYVVRVHRMNVDDRFVIFDPLTAMEADAHLLDANHRSTSVEVGELRATRMRPSRNITLIQGYAKGEKMDAIVRDATELGLTTLIPAIAERSVPRPSDMRSRTDRWERIAIEASRQCGRGDVMQIATMLPLVDAIAQFAQQDGVHACMDPGASTPLGHVLQRATVNSPIVLVVGPEGGLSEIELASCERAGFVRSRLGEFVLRTETVCAAALGAVFALQKTFPEKP